MQNIINQVLHGDCLEVLKTLKENSVDSIVTDPPYELGFMGKAWDNTGIANNKEMWAECLRVLKPGGYLLSFGGTRTYHRMASAIEDAGFEVRDMVEWVYGSGFPKSLNIGKAVDKLQGNEREVVGEKDINAIKALQKFKEQDGRTIKTDFSNIDIGITKGTSEWEGWGTALKPAHEPICMARKPLAEKTVAENCLKYGTGGINIDESRVEGTDKPRLGNTDKSDSVGYGAESWQKSGTTPSVKYHLQGNDLSSIIEVCQLNHLNLPVNSAELKRFQDDTTNLIRNLCSAVESADMLILEKTLGKLREDTTSMDMLCSEEMSVESMNISLNTFLSGNEYTEELRKVTRYIISTGKKMITDWKISSALTVPLIEVLLTLVKREVTTPAKSARFPANLLHNNSEEVRECFPESGGGKFTKSGNRIGGDCEYSVGISGRKDAPDNYGDSGNASRFFKSIIYQAKASKSERNKGCEGLEEKQYSHDGRDKEIENAFQRNKSVSTNNHPTIKPIALMEYLIKMVTPKGGIVLDPFAGSGSTLVAAKQNGYQYIGIEMTAEYIPIIEARLTC